MPFEYSFAIKYYIIAFIIIFIVSFSKSKRKKVLWLYRDVIYLFALLTLFAIIYILLYPSLRDFYQSNYFSEFLFYHTSRIIRQMVNLLPLLIFYIIKKDIKLRDFSVFIKNEKDIFWGIGIGIFGAIWMIFRIFLSDKIGGIPEISIIYKLDLFPLYFTFYIILSSFIQEIYYRGILIPSFEEKFSTEFSVFLSVLIYSLFHGMSIISWAFLLQHIIWGYIFSWLFVKRRTIIPSVIAHSILNASIYVKYLLAAGIIENPLL